MCNAVPSECAVFGSQVSGDVREATSPSTVVWPAGSAISRIDSTRGSFLGAGTRRSAATMCRRHSEAGVGPPEMRSCGLEELKGAVDFSGTASLIGCGDQRPQNPGIRGAPGFDQVSERAELRPLKWLAARWIDGAEKPAGPVEPTQLEGEFGGQQQPSAASAGVGCELGGPLDGGQHRDGPSMTRRCEQSLFNFSRHVLVRFCCRLGSVPRRPVRMIGKRRAEGGVRSLTLRRRRGLIDRRR